MPEGWGGSGGGQGNRELCLLAQLCPRVSLNGERLIETEHLVLAVPGEQWRKERW